MLSFAKTRDDRVKSATSFSAMISHFLLILFDEKSNERLQSNGEDSFMNLTGIGYEIILRMFRISSYI